MADDLVARLAGLSPERRRLLEALARKRASGVAPPDAPLKEEGFRLDPGGPLEPVDVRRFYDRVSTQLDASPYRDHALFLNYGYVANGAPSFASVSLPPELPARNCARLVLEVIGDHPLRPIDRVLDVGCGRGGTISVLRRWFTVGPITGLDLSPVAIAFCTARHGDGATWFVEGTAIHLPFPEGHFDVVTNVESSHAYGDPDPFFAEVARVLRPGGVFLYTDVVAAERVADRERLWSGLGFDLEHKRDITANVLLSCDETAAANARAFRGDNDASLLDRFLAVPESSFYRLMKDGRQPYLLYRLRRR